jgi:hypothetical protein
VGLVKEVARYFFHQRIEMKRMATQDVDGSQFTSWRVTILGPIEIDDKNVVSLSTIKPNVQGNVTMTSCPLGFS